MAVVRREGDWRLEKKNEGIYEITYQKKAQMKVLTPEYSPERRNIPMIDAIPVREVGSYSEAEGLFEEKAHGGSPIGFSQFNAGGSSTTDTGIGSLYEDMSLGGGESESLEDINLPPGGLSLVLLLVGGLVLSQTGFDPGSIVFLAGMGFVVSGVVILGWAGVLYRTNGWSDAYEFLVTVDEDQSNSDSTDESVTTPPTPQKLKDKLYFDRANQRCEWCEERIDHPDVHHIKPRSEGGPNNPGNLIVLCQNCHRKADRNAIPRSKLKAKVKRLPEITSD